MARSKRPTPPTPQQMPRCGIDTLFFTIPTVHTTIEEILPYLQQYIDPTLTADDLIIEPGNGFYRQCVAVQAKVEDPKEFHRAPTAPHHYKGVWRTLLRVYFHPKPKSEGKLYENNTTSFMLHGELLRRIDYMPILKWIIASNGNITRLDLFKDDFDGLLKFDILHALCSISTYHNHIQSRLVQSYQDINNGENSIYLSHGKTKQIHIYNKALQCGEKFHHVRCEIRFRKGKFLTGIAKELCNGADAETVISSLISKYLTFKVPTGAARINDRQPYQWWSMFLQAASPIKIKDLEPVKTIRKKTLQELMEQKQTFETRLVILEQQILSHPDYMLEVF